MSFLAALFTSLVMERSSCGLLLLRAALALWIRLSVCAVIQGLLARLGSTSKVLAVFVNTVTVSGEY